MANRPRLAGIKRGTLGLRVCLTIAIAAAPRLASAQSLPGTNLTATIKVAAVTMSHDTAFVSYSVSNSASSLEKLFSFMVVVPGAHAIVARPGLATQDRVNGNYGPVTVSAHFVGSATVDSSISLPGKATDADFLYLVTTADPSVTSVSLVYNAATLGTVTPGGPLC